ncbi:MAG: prolyl oligopeptidase family serine peptidase [Candidatus Hydrogenedentes bacterium]|nr:prolyl oligopeptidase family serine peptidase [Candidatus Hydrogenedentota bacterium]
MFRYRLILCAAILVAASVCGAEPAPGSTQYGVPRLEFLVDEARAFLLLPTQPAADGTKPWVWYAPTFIGQHPDPSHEWMARQLLDAGFALGGIEVGESYGSPAGRALYSRYYEHVVRTYGLDAKACLLPQSRGGLMLLNWAAENAERVQCIAGIYAVCNLESYPGVEKACGAYGLDAAGLGAALAQHNPIARVEALAKARVPALFIHGDADTVVPVEKNAGEWMKRYVAAGGPGALIVVPGKGHEVCPEFFQSEALVRFLLQRGAR